MSKIYCSVPYKVAFTNSEFGFRNCCSAHPQINSSSVEKFENWWFSTELNEFRQQLGKTDFPDACYRCKLSEESSGKSHRTAINKQYSNTNPNITWPQSWNVMFGNVCNLGCWICNEKSSSMIENHKKKLKMLPNRYVSSQKLFNLRWPTLREDILKSYNYHSTVGITILGGEPLYNKDVVEFLEFLIANNLSKRTRLEFHTNATIFSPAIQRLLQQVNWNHTTILLSLDAVGKKAEWLRYGCKWEKIVNNISLFKQHANYLQITATVSILSIMDLPALFEFAQLHNIPLHTSIVSSPDYLSLESWPGPADHLVKQSQLEMCGFGNLYNLIGSKPDHDAPEKIKNYIQSFASLRNPLSVFDPALAKIFDVD